MAEKNLVALNAPLVRKIVDLGNSVGSVPIMGKTREEMRAQLRSVRK